MEKYLERCLDSVFEQGLEDYECILVDDCSTDGSREIIEKYCRKNQDHFRYIYHTENKKLGAARNTGILAAAGKYLFFLDSDDYLMPESLKAMCDKAKETDADNIVAFYREVFDEAQPKCYRPLGEGDSGGDVISDPNILQMIKYPHFAWGKLIKKNVIVDNNLFYPERIMFEDVAVGPLLVCYASTQAVSKECVCYYQRDDSISRHFSPAKVNDEIECANMFIKECEKRNIIISDSIGNLKTQVVFAKYFLSAVYYPWCHIADDTTGDGLRLQDTIKAIVKNVYDEFVNNLFIPYIIEQDKITALNLTFDTQKQVTAIGRYLATLNNFAIWGAGKKGRDFLEKYRNYAVNCKAVIDGNVNNRGKKMPSGHGIISIDDIDDSIDTILVMNQYHYHDIKNTIESRGRECNLIDFERKTIDIIGSLLQ